MGFLVDLFNWFDVIHGTERIPTTTREREREKEREREREKEKERKRTFIVLFLLTIMFNSILWN